MKKTLTVLCLMIAVAGVGQEIISFGLVNHRKIDSVTIHKYDTIPIIYLYCDTARRMSVTTDAYILNGKLFQEIDTFYYEPNYELRWDFGYDVLGWEKRVDPPGTFCYPCPQYERTHIGYLDRQKNPIRKSMIIWQTKTIEE